MHRHGSADYEVQKSYGNLPIKDHGGAKRLAYLGRPRQKVLTQEGSGLNRFPSTIGGSGDDYLHTCRIFSSLWLSVATLVASTVRYSRNEGVRSLKSFLQTKKTAPERKGSAHLKGFISKGHSSLAAHDIAIFLMSKRDEIIPSIKSRD